MIDEHIFSNHFEYNLKKYNYPQPISYIVGVLTLKFIKNDCFPASKTLTQKEYERYVITGINKIFERYAEYSTREINPVQRSENHTQHGIS